MNETRYPEHVSFRTTSESVQQVKEIARAEDQSFGAVLRRLLAKALKQEGKK